MSLAPHSTTVFAIGAAIGGAWHGNNACAASCIMVAMFNAAVVHLSRKRPGEPEDDREHGDWSPPQ